MSSNISSLTAGDPSDDESISPLQQYSQFLTKAKTFLEELDSAHECVNTQSRVVGGLLCILRRLCDSPFLGTDAKFNIKKVVDDDQSQEVVTMSEKLTCHQIKNKIVFAEEKVMVIFVKLQGFFFSSLFLTIYFMTIFSCVSVLK
jgi:hypothetical protein